MYQVLLYKVLYKVLFLTDFSVLIAVLLWQFLKMHYTKIAAFPSEMSVSRGKTMTEFARKEMHRR